MTGAPLFQVVLRAIAFRILIGATIFAVLAFTAGCTSAATNQPGRPDSPPTRSARVEIANHSPCHWEITFAAPPPLPPALVRVGPQAAATVTLAPGDYRVTQTALDGVPAATATTRFELQVTAGATYGWALATLLTGPDGAAP